MKRKLIRVIYEYTDGKEELTGEDLENFEDNISMASALVSTRGYLSFKPVNWKKIS